MKALPKWYRKLIEAFLSKDKAEFLLGDIEELYLKKRQIDKRRANRYLLAEVLSVFRPSLLSLAIRSKTQYILLHNFFLVSYRNMLRNRYYSIIKIGGYAIGVAASLMLTLFVLQKLSFDRHISDHDRIYRLRNHWNENQNVEIWPAFEAPVKRTIDEEIPGTEKVARLVPHSWFLAGQNLISVAGEGKSHYQSDIVYADQEFIEMMDFKMKYGALAFALSRPRSLIMSASAAQKYFGEEDPTGRTVTFNNDPDEMWQVGGVYNDLPATTHFNFDVILSLKDQEFWPGEQNSWCCSNYMTYVKLRADQDPKEFEKKLLHIRDTYQYAYAEKQSADQAEILLENYRISLQPIADIHLYSAGMRDDFAKSDIKIVRAFAGIAILILILAIVNFVNLTTARASTRTREFGIRKAIGSSKLSMGMQIIIESLMYSLISVAFGLVITVILLPFFNSFMNTDLTIPWNHPVFYVAIFLSVLLLGLVAGLYPSVVLAGLSFRETLRGRSGTLKTGKNLQSGMLFVQFGICTLMVLGTLAIQSQLRFILEKNPGFAKDRLITIRGTHTLDNSAQTFKSELLNMTSVQHVTLSDYLPVEGTSRNTNSFYPAGRAETDMPTQAQFWTVDDDYLETLSIKLLHGRNLSEDLASDSARAIVNQAFVRQVDGIDIGSRVTNGDEFEIAGIVEDFHFENMKEPIRPLVMRLGKSTGTMTVKVSADEFMNVLSSIAVLWEEYQPDQPLRTEVMNVRFEEMYADVRQTRSMLTFFAAIAILIAAIGLLAMVGFLVEQKRKEISIRKVLGATWQQLSGVLIRRISVVMTLAVTISLMIGTSVINSWLEDYAYRITVGPAIYGGTLLLIVLVAVITVSREIIIAVQQNPADSLQKE